MLQTRTAGGARTLEARYYLSPHIFQQELERIFFTHWLCLGREEQLPPGHYFLYQLGVESVIVVRDRQGQARAFYNVCRHRGTRLCAAPAGELPASIQCPYHAWTYGLDGALLGAPHMAEVASFDKTAYGLRPVALAAWEGFLFLNFHPTPLPFTAAMAPLLGKFDRWELPRLRLAHATSYEVAANWKLIFQNYSECYHCPTLHPALNRLTPYRSAWNDLEEGPILGGPMEISAQSMTMSGRYCALPFAGLEETARQCVFYYTILPNLFVSLHPDYVLVHRLEPLAADRTRIVCEWLFHPDALTHPTFDPRGAVDFWDMTNRQDWQVCELTQQGVQSRAYSPGPYAELESVLAAFDRAYLRLMAQDEAP